MVQGIVINILPHMKMLSYRHMKPVRVPIHEKPEQLRYSDILLLYLSYLDFSQFLEASLIVVVVVFIK